MMLADCFINNIKGLKRGSLRNLEIKGFWGAKN
jgi:hypothetical protein